MSSSSLLVGEGTRNVILGDGACLGTGSDAKLGSCEDPRVFLAGAEGPLCPGSRRLNLWRCLVLMIDQLISENSNWSFLPERNF